ncbi:UNVERIFIED_CONTAM: Serine/threonine-protein kinase AtPK2/AtPK19 [Sesamum calycinum]|uniref:non-specific serine/threonine protein kinase n=1 Tax=Sesamum calycinum TaxID=2727403 RepID=A0AAW2RPU4_9LAMI
MVSSQFSKFAGTNLLKPFNNHMLLSGEAPDVFSFDHVDLDFSDVFGPAPTPTTLPQISEDSTNFVVPTAVNDLVYDEPAVVYSRSHSFVGPTTCVNQLSKLSKLTLHDRGDPLELVGEVDEDAHENFSESSIEKFILEESISQVDSNSEKPIGLEDFEFLKLVGQGAFGKVYQVRKTGSSEIFAMKTKYRLYLVLDFVNGGHLFFQLYHQGLFREDLGRIYAAEIVSAVAHLHAHGIMHRDLKPENILLDAEGHAMLTDFGLAKQFDEETRSNSMCGTLEYMAPEIILGKGHDKAADWWSVGILLYEMLTGKPPFVGGNRQKIQQKILKDKLKLPAFLSSDAHSLLKGLLQKDASKRLGSGPRGSAEIKGHKWFKSINWKKLEAREIQPSFLPQVAGKQCVANFDERWTKMPVLVSPASSPKFAENPFKGFSYVRPAAQFLQDYDVRSLILCQLHQLFFKVTVD